MSRLVRPQTLRGFRDLLPQDMLLRNAAVDRIRQVYETYGYAPLDTPVLESLPTLAGTGGDETDKLIFTAQARDEQPVGMRFDLTVPFARVIAEYTPHTLKLPFRRYHIGPVFRADEPQPEQGRFRQFTQFDVDVAGTTSVAADAEIVAVMAEALEALDLRPAPLDESKPGYFLRLNNRRIVDAFLLGLGISDPDRSRHVLRVLDKRDKVGDAAIRLELGEGRRDSSGDRIPGVGLSPDLIDRLLDFVAIGGATRAEVIAEVAKHLPEGEVTDRALAEVRELAEHLDALGVSEEGARFDPSLARGLDYYTGTVYEGTLAQAGVGSVIGGGRYDGLVSRFSDEPVPAVGASIGLDRLVTGLTNLGLGLGTDANTARVLVLMMPGVSGAEASRAAADLRAGGIPAELYVGDAIGKVGKQLAHANARGFAAAVIIGKNEVAEGTVTVKDLDAGNRERSGITDNEKYRSAGDTGQRTAPRAELADVVGQVLGGGPDR